MVQYLFVAMMRFKMEKGVDRPSVGLCWNHKKGGLGLPVVLVVNMIGVNTGYSKKDRCKGLPAEASALFLKRPG